MTGLAHLLRRENSLWQVLKVRSPEAVVLTRAVRSIREGAGPALANDEMGPFQTRMAEAVATQQIEVVSRRDLRRAPEAFFQPPLPLGRDDALRTTILQEISRRNQKSAVYGVVRQYLEHFDAADPAIIALASWLRATMRDWKGLWAERARRYELFEPARAPATVARAAMAAPVPPRRHLEDMGLGEASISGGLGIAAFGAACAKVAGQSPKDALPAQLRLIEWGCGPRGFEIDAQWPSFATAMLEPWKQDPPETHRERISAVLTAYADDPRTSSRSQWSRVPEAAQKILMSWLTRASVLQFLDVVGEVARDDHWRYRRAFWLSFLEGRHISRAWVAFGPRAVPYARRVQARLGERNLSFGEVLRGTGRAADQSALMVEIGDLLIVDWSHSGKYNVWPRGAGGRPTFFRPHYDASDLDSAPYRASHTSSDRYGWQSALADIIRRNTGVTVDNRRWRPGSR